MKKILGLALGLMISAFTFAQSPATFTDAGVDYDKATTTAFHFNLDETISHNDINTNSSYYTDYFTVVATHNGTGHDITITLIQDDEMSRKVIHRFFVSLQVSSINVEGNEVDMDPFMDTYIIK